MPSHDVFVHEQSTMGDAPAKEKRIIKKDGYDALILQKISPEEVADARAKAADIREVIAPSGITGWADLKRKMEECFNDITHYSESRKDLPLKKSSYNASGIKKL